MKNRNKEREFEKIFPLPTFNIINMETSSLPEEMAKGEAFSSALSKRRMMGIDASLSAYIDLILKVFG